MASPPKKTFPDVDDDEDLKARLRSVVDASGAHSLAPRPPVAPAPAATLPTTPAQIPAPIDSPVPSPPPQRAATATPTPAPAASRGREDGGPTITLRGIPAELWRELNLRAVEDKTTVRALVLQALRDRGYSVPAAELEDKRKYNGGRRN